MGLRNLADIRQMTINEAVKEALSLYDRIGVRRIRFEGPKSGVKQSKKAMQLE